MSLEQPKALDGRQLDLSQDVGFCVLKPDYADIQKDFERDLSGAGLDVAHSRRLRLPPGIVEYLYSDSAGEDFYPTMMRSLVAREVVAMVVLRPEDCDSGTAVQHKLEFLKRGRSGYPNLRSKYHRPEHIVGDELFEEWKKKQLKPDQLDQVTVRLTQQNVFHASDGPHDAIGTLLRLREGNGMSENFFQGADERVDGLVQRLDVILARHKKERDMSQITREWRVIQGMPEDDDSIPIRQVYTWLLTNDDQVVIVSKDGESWQLPGGKPDPGENAVKTAHREIKEETGIDIKDYLGELTFFGEYNINDHSTDIHPPRYRQVRSWLRLPMAASELSLSTAGECEGQRPEDAVRFIKVVPTKDILKYIEWLERADEYKALKRNKVVSRAVQPIIKIA